MSDAVFDVVFSGELVRGSDPATVKANLARLFKMDAARVEKLFSGQAVVLKKNADQATAMKFRAVLKQAGAVCQLNKQGSDALVSGAPDSVSASPAPSKAEVVQAPSTASERSASASATSTISASQTDTPAAETATGDQDMVGTIRTGGTGFSGAFSVAAVGADMDNSEKAPPPDAPDVSHLSMGSAGEDLGQLKDDKTVVVPDISHLSVEKD